MTIERLDDLATPPLGVALWRGSCNAPDRETVAKYRDVTIAWLRYGYREAIFEADTIDEALGKASQAGHGYCLLPAYGCVVHEQWDAGDSACQGDFFTRLLAWAERQTFTVAGIAGEDGGTDDKGPLCLLVDLTRIDAALERISRHDWLPLPRSLACDLVDLRAKRVSNGPGIASLLGRGILSPDASVATGELTDDQRRFVETVRCQVASARRGVFLWNIEAYDDIERPPPGFEPPVSSLYCVSAGFKPNRILHTHGMDSRTRVVFFDYSAAALEVRQTLVDKWDGADFPHFVRYLFRKFPHPATFYQLWQNVTPEQVTQEEFEAMWSRELQRWGGAATFQEHWRAYRKLRHEFVCCDLLSDPSPLLRTMRSEPGSVVWWSNAFFTMYGNWLLPACQRREAYRRFISALAARHPHVHLVGSDHQNVNVNGICAADYWERFRDVPDDDLVPLKLHRTVIRM